MAPKGSRDAGQPTQTPKISNKKDTEISPKPVELTQNNSETDQQSNDAAVIRSVKFTSNGAFDSISPPDNTVEICGYIDVAERKKTVGKERKYTLLKFVLNNNSGKRVQCVAWQEQAHRMKGIVQLNKILRLNGAVAKKIDNPTYNVGNVPFELSIQGHTEVVDRGSYEEPENATPQPELADWDDVGNMEGRLIKIMGNLKMMFNPTKHKTGEAMYTIGAITDGRLKLAIRVTDSGKLPNDLEKGCPISIVGILHYDGNNPYVKVEKGSHITRVEGSRMDEDEMMEAAGMPRKKIRTY